MEDGKEEGNGRVEDGKEEGEWKSGRWEGGGMEGGKGNGKWSLFALDFGLFCE